MTPTEHWASFYANEPEGRYIQPRTHYTVRYNKQDHAEINGLVCVGGTLYHFTDGLKKPLVVHNEYQEIALSKNPRVQSAIDSLIEDYLKYVRTLTK